MRVRRLQQASARRLSDFRKAWLDPATIGFAVVVVLAALLLGALSLTVLRPDSLQLGLTTGLRVGAAVGFLMGLAGGPAGILAATLLRFGVAKHVITETMGRLANVAARILIFTVGVLGGLLYASSSDPISFPWLLVGLLLGMTVGLLSLLFVTFMLTTFVGSVIGIPLALALDYYVGEGEARRRPYWAVRQRLADRYWRPADDEPASDEDLSGNERVLVIDQTPLACAPTMLEFIDHGYPVTFATPSDLGSRPDRIPKDLRLIVAPRAVLAPWMSGRRFRPEALGKDDRFVALHAQYPKARFLIVDEDELAEKLGVPLVTFHVHGSIDDGPELLRAARIVLGPHARRRRVRVLDWLEHHVLPSGPGRRRTPEERLLEVGITQAASAEQRERGAETPTDAGVTMTTMSTDQGDVAVYEIQSWDDWTSAEERIQTDGCEYAFLVGPHDTRDGGWMVYVRGANRGEVGTPRMARALLSECIRLEHEPAKP